MKATSSFMALGLLATLAGTVPASAQTFKAVTYFDSQYLSVSGTDGTASQSGTLNAGVTPDGLAAYQGSLYTFDSTSNSLLQLNADTGATLASYSVGITGSLAPGGLAISSSGVVYLADPLSSSSQSSPASTLYAFSLTGGPALTIGTTSDLLSGLAFDSSDTLYGLGKGDGELYTINTASAKDSLIGNLDPAANTPGVFGSIGNSPIAALTFSGGTLYAAADDSLYTVSTGTGAATLVGPIADSNGFPYNNVSGIVSAPVPEASSVVSFGLLLAFGLGGVVIATRKRKAATSTSA